MKKILKIFSAVSNFMQRRSDGFAEAMFPDAPPSEEVQPSKATGIAYIGRKAFKIFATIVYILVSAFIYILIFMGVFRPLIFNFVDLIKALIDFDSSDLGVIAISFFNVVGYILLYLVIHILVFRPLKIIGVALARFK